jgi:hypothetical protein
MALKAHSFVSMLQPVKYELNRILNICGESGVVDGGRGCASSPLAHGMAPLAGAGEPTAGVASEGVASTAATHLQELQHDAQRDPAQGDVAAPLVEQHQRGEDPLVQLACGVHEVVEGLIVVAARGRRGCRANVRFLGGGR